MSGGHFQYEQDRLKWMIARPLMELIRYNKVKPEGWWDDDLWEGQVYSDDIIEEFKKGLEALRIAYVYIQRIDWLVSGDDGEDSFRKRLAHDLKNYHWMTTLGEDVEDD